MTLPAAGELSPCPHCGASARVEASPALRWRCGVCGGPLVPTPAGVPRSNGELARLVRAQRLRAMALGWMAGAFLLTAIALMGAGVGLLVMMFAHGAAAVLGVLALIAAAAAVTSVRRARARRREAQVELDAAWDRVADEVLAARVGELTAAELAGEMKTDVGHAEGMLSRLSATGRARVEVTEEAELAYRVEEGAGAGADAGADAGAGAGPGGVRR